MHETATDGKLESGYRWGKGLHKMGIQILDCVFPLLTCRAQLEGGPGDADLCGEVEGRPPSSPGRFRGCRLVGKVGIRHRTGKVEEAPPRHGEVAGRGSGAPSGVGADVLDGFGADAGEVSAEKSRLLGGFGGGRGRGLRGEINVIVDCGDRQCDYYWNRGTGQKVRGACKSDDFGATRSRWLGRATE
jgi:hypothetical protein